MRSRRQGRCCSRGCRWPRFGVFNTRKSLVGGVRGVVVSEGALLAEYYSHVVVVGLVLVEVGPQRVELPRDALPRGLTAAFPTAGREVDNRPR